MSGHLSHEFSDVRIGHLYLSKEQIEDIDRRLNDFLLARKPFLQHSYSLGQLAESIGVPLHHLSAFINQHYDISFNDLINKCRINYCIVTFLKETWQNKKIETIARESGFNNRNTFSTAFKKFTGMTPSNYFANNYKS
jgi:YesN/AraC family two-component response regulator